LSLRLSTVDNVVIEDDYKNGVIKIMEYRV
jgi:hypothetical protein